MLIDGDKDIDVSVFKYNKKNIIGIIEMLMGINYRVRSTAYNGFIFKYKLSRKNTERIIDFNIFRISKNNDYFYCPQPVKKHDIYIVERLKQVLRIFIAFYVNARSINVDYSNSFLKYFYDCSTWLIPIKYFNHLSKLNGMLSCPYDLDEYLSFRYGNWKEKINNWNFKIHDGGFIDESPMKYI